MLLANGAVSLQPTGGGRWRGAQADGLRTPRTGARSTQVAQCDPEQWSFGYVLSRGGRRTLCAPAQLLGSITLAAPERDITAFA